MVNNDIYNDQQIIQNQVVSPLDIQTDPILTFLMIPILPFIKLFQLQQLLIQQMNQATQASIQGSQKTKITSISRNGNNLDIIEKWV